MIPTIAGIIQTKEVCMELCKLKLDPTSCIAAKIKCDYDIGTCNKLYRPI